KQLLYRHLSGTAVLGNSVIVGDFDGYIHWLAVTDGKLQARIRPSSSPQVSTPVVVDNVAYLYSDNGRLTALALAPLK
ncbi:hypothetical protein TI04_08995, partial [Achromatium sp. WMS2]